MQNLTIYFKSKWSLAFHSWGSNRVAFLILKIIKLDTIFERIFLAMNKYGNDNDLHEEKYWLLDRARSGPWYGEQELKPSQCLTELRSGGVWGFLRHGRLKKRGLQRGWSRKLKKFSHRGLACACPPRNHAISTNERLKAMGWQDRGASGTGRDEGPWCFHGSPALQTCSYGPRKPRHKNKKNWNRSTLRKEKLEPPRSVWKLTIN